MYSNIAGFFFLQKIDKNSEFSFTLVAETMEAEFDPKICVGRIRNKINYFLNSCIFVNVLSV